MLILSFFNSCFNTDNSIEYDFSNSKNCSNHISIKKGENSALYIPRGQLIFLNDTFNVTMCTCIEKIKQKQFQSTEDILEKDETLCDAVYTRISGKKIGSRIYLIKK